MIQITLFVFLLIFSLVSSQATTGCVSTDLCGVCNGDGSTCCSDYHGYTPQEALAVVTHRWNWVLIDEIAKLQETLNNMRLALSAYSKEVDSGRLDLGEFIDALHGFCGGCECSTQDCENGKTGCGAEECKLNCDCLPLSEMIVIQAGYYGALNSLVS